MKSLEPKVHYPPHSLTLLREALGLTRIRSHNPGRFFFFFFPQHSQASFTWGEGRAARGKRKLGFQVQPFPFQGCCGHAFCLSHFYKLSQ